MMTEFTFLDELFHFAWTTRLFIYC